jgi:hypothetical protein
MSTASIALAVGLSNFRASGSTSAADFSHCVITKLSESGSEAVMSVEVHDPLDTPMDNLAYAKTKDNGSDLPNGVQPGYSAPIKDTSGNTIGAKALAWTPDGRKMLVIQIVRGAPGRDHRADVVDFMRQLRPTLLT